MGVPAWALFPLRVVGGDGYRGWEMEGRAGNTVHLGLVVVLGVWVVFIFVFAPDSLPF